MSRYSLVSGDTCNFACGFAGLGGEGVERRGVQVSWSGETPGFPQFCGSDHQFTVLITAELFLISVINILICLVTVGVGVAVGRSESSQFDLDH